MFFRESLVIDRILIISPFCALPPSRTCGPLPPPPHAFNGPGINFIIKSSRVIIERDIAGRRSTNSSMTRLLRANYTHSMFYQRIDRVANSFGHRQPPSTYVDSDLWWRKATWIAYLLEKLSYNFVTSEHSFLLRWCRRNTNIVKKIVHQLQYGEKNSLSRTEEKYEKNKFSPDKVNKSKNCETIWVNKTVYIRRKYISLKSVLLFASE